MAQSAVQSLVQQRNESLPGLGLGESLSLDYAMNAEMTFNTC